MKFDLLMTYIRFMSFAFTVIIGSCLYLFRHNFFSALPEIVLLHNIEIRSIRIAGDH